MAQFLKFLTEGGNAVSVASRINQPNVASTLDDIYKNVLPEFKIKKTDTDMYTILGSAGKKKDNESSGDIDLAISIEQVMKGFKLKTKEEAMKKIQDIVAKLGTEMAKKHGHDGQQPKDFFKLMPGLETFSLGYPIDNKDGKQDGLFVQLDIMPSDNIDMIGWTMSAPHHTESSTKGVIRAELLSAIIKYSDFKVVKKDSSGEPLIVKRYYMDLKSGLYYMTQERKMGKSGKYTSAFETKEKKLISSNKDKIIQFLFGKKVKADDANTFEKLWTLLNSDDFKFPDKREEIVKAFKENAVRHKVDMPKELD